MDRRETERILEALTLARAAGQRAAVATVVRVRGSAYRREGTRILICEAGTHECLLSGGCLEPMVTDAAARVIATGEPVLSTYNLEEDSVWGLSIGCSGAVDIYIERVDDDPVTRAWLEVLAHGQPAVRVTALSGGSGSLLVTEQDVVGSTGNSALDAQAIAEARARLSAPTSQAGVDHVGGADLFFEISEPPPRLVIFGAGHDAQPLAQQAWTVGFDVTVVDVREGFLAGRFPGATLVAAHFSEFADRVPLGPRSYVVIMNHHLERDRESLRFALASPAPYLGVLGPRSRFQKLLVALANEQPPPRPASLARVRSPVGLALGAETPEEIAVSILAEILAIRRGFEGGFLAGREDSLHRALSMSARARS